MTKSEPKKRPTCHWPGDDPLMNAYHDTEWGVCVHDDAKHFEFLLLDAFQAGLSWATILNKREHFRTAFDGFDPKTIAGYDEKKIQKLLQNKNIVRNQLKIRAAVENAKQFLAIQAAFGSFDTYIWQFTGNRTIVNQWQTHADIPATSPESDAMSRDLKKRGFKFTGATICYAYMQAAGMVNDHLTTCFRYKELTG